MAIETQKNSYFTFTEEGRRLIISQEGGIKFAVLGYILVQGLGLETTKSDFSTKYSKLTLEDLISNPSATIVMKDLPYEFDKLNNLYPKSNKDYQTALESDNLPRHLFSAYYVPTNEFNVITEDDKKIPYGMYRFNFDMTNIKIDMNDLKTDKYFYHIALIGKQYTETTSAVYNVNQRQSCSIIGFIQLGEPIELLQNQKAYVSYQCQLRFTVREDDEDAIADIEITPEIKETADKLFHINNGLKTLKGGVAIGQNKQVLDELQLDQEGAIAIDKSLMVADCIDSIETDNQFNGVGLIHSINKYPDDKKTYIPQYLMSTVYAKDNLAEETEVYTVEMKLDGLSYKYNNNYGPICRIGAVGGDDIGFDIGGLDNVYTKGINDRTKSIFSKYNTSRDNTGGQILFGSDYNYFSAGANDNQLLNSDGNHFWNGAYNNTLVASNNNQMFDGIHDVALLNSHQNKIEDTSHNSTLVGSDNNNIEQSAEHSQLYSSTSCHFTVAAYNTIAIATSGATYTDSAHDTISIGSFDGKFYGGSYESKELFSKNTKAFEGAYKNISIGSYSSDFYNKAHQNMDLHGLENDFFGTTTQTLYANSRTCSAENSCYSSFLNGHYIAVLGPANNWSFDPKIVLRDEDKHNNNNVIINGAHLKARMMADTLIMDQVNLYGGDDTATPAFRIKGCNIVGSDGSNLYNARNAYLYNSPRTRIYAYNEDADKNPTKYKLLGYTGVSTSTGNYTASNANYASDGEKLKNEVVAENSRLCDLMRLNIASYNSYGNNIDLSTAAVPSTEKSFKTDRTTFIGGGHNNYNGGKNITFIGSKWGQSSQKDNQVIMGFMNENVDADLIIGDGYIPENGNISILGTKYTYEELDTIATKKETIDEVRKASQVKPANALEFYKKHGKLVLKKNSNGNCDSILSIDPVNGIQFTDKNGKIKAEVVPTTRRFKTIFNCDWVPDSTASVKPDGTNKYMTGGYYRVYDYWTDSDTVKNLFAGKTGKEIFDMMFIDCPVGVQNPTLTYSDASKGSESPVTWAGFDTSTHYSQEHMELALRYSIVRNVFVGSPDGVVSGGDKVGCGPLVASCGTDVDTVNEAFFGEGLHDIVFNFASLENNKTNSSNCYSVNNLKGHLLLLKLQPYHSTNNEKVRMFDSPEELKIKFIFRDDHSDSASPDTNTSNLNEDFWANHATVRPRRWLTMIATFADALWMASDHSKSASPFQQSYFGNENATAKAAYKALKVLASPSYESATECIAMSWGGEFQHVNFSGYTALQYGLYNKDYARTL